MVHALKNLLTPDILKILVKQHFSRHIASNQGFNELNAIISNISPGTLRLELSHRGQ